MLNKIKESNYKRRKLKGYKEGFSKKKSNIFFFRKVFSSIESVIWLVLVSILLFTLFGMVISF